MCIAGITAAGTEKYEDPAGLSLPAAAHGFMDCWKRPEELVQNVPHVPLVCVKSLLDTETKGKGVMQHTRCIIR